MTSANRVKESTISTSTSAISLAGASPGFRTFAAKFASGATINDVMVGPDSAGAWLLGDYTINGSTLTRIAIIDSSADGADVTLAAGSKDVFATASAQTISGARDIAFAAAVPLTQVGTAFMPSQTVASVLAFSVAANPVRGALAFVRLVADGVNAPTFSGMKEWNGSSGYDNRNGIVNVVQFFCDGTDVWYSIAQAVGAVPVPSKPGAPTIGAASAGDGTASVYFTPPASNGGAAITGYPVTAYKASDNSVAGTVTATSSPANFTGLTNGVAVYFKVAATNSAGTGPQSAASNNVTPSVASASYTRLTSLVGMTESGTGPYSYTGDGTQGYGSNSFGGITPSLQNGMDGSVSLVVGNYNTGGNEPMIGLLDPGWGPVAYASFHFAFYTQGSTGKYVPISSGSIGAPTNNVTVANGDVMRLRRSGTNVIADVSKDGGSTWTVVYTWTGAFTGAAKFQIMAAKSSQANNIVGVGLV